jgi:hypothetical protein
MMAGGYDTLTVYKESAPCPNRSVLLVQRDHRHNGWSVFLRKVGDGFPGKRIPFQKEQEAEDADEKQ